MFSSQEYLDKKTGPYGIGRLSYLQSLVTEYEETSSDGDILAIILFFSIVVLKSPGRERD